MRYVRGERGSARYERGERKWERGERVENATKRQLNDEKIVELDTTSLPVRLHLSSNNKKRNILDQKKEEIFFSKNENIF